ncbi:hypothetical protein [Neisseria sp.]|uniref:DUF6630 family protein n=1 Tax=Neisseria sp. TaxID=192066 RepID=UPI0035A0475B
MKITFGMIIVAILFVVVILVAFMFTGKKNEETPAQKPSPKPLPQPQGEVPAAVVDEREKLFRNWLSVLYQDNPRGAEGIVSDIRRNAPSEGIVQNIFHPENIISPFGGNEMDADHAFAVDWKDSDSFIAFADKMAARFRFSLAWTEQDKTEAMPPELMKKAYEQFAQRKAVLYNAETGGDYYFLMVVPKRDSEDFEAASKQWGVEIRPADQPY